MDFGFKLFHIEAISSFTPLNTIGTRFVIPIIRNGSFLQFDSSFRFLLGWIIGRSLVNRLLRNDYYFGPLKVLCRVSFERRERMNLVSCIHI